MHGAGDERKEALRVGLPDHEMMAAVAATRFGLGAKPGEIEAVGRDAKGFLKSQIRASGADQPAGPSDTSGHRLNAFREAREERRVERVERAADARAAAQAPGQPGDSANMAAQAGPPDRRADAAVLRQQQVGRVVRDDIAGDFTARAQLAATTDAAFRERWANFWANHFTVSATKQITATIIGPFEDEAIRPHVFGRFLDLLGAAETHPAMLTYLDQIQSIGPNSQAAEFSRRGPRGVGAGFLQPAVQRTVGLNENLAREIMELHTVGVNGGYTQADVTEFARAMTGISIGGPRDPSYGTPVFRGQAHEPGARRIMGVSYAPGGKEQTAAILTDLAAKPATARFICTKIARHFVADDPPPALVARLEAAWTSSGGDLARVAEALIDAPEAWDPKPGKFKAPYEYLVSSFRASGSSPTAFQQIGPILTSLGQKPFSAPSPKGWPEDAQSWAAPDAIVKRMQFAQSFSQNVVRDRNPSMLAEQALGARLGADSAKAIARAESRPEGFALLLMSPEFQRR
jgi:uncharacterized protein (DUF1800 family)